MYFLGFNWNPNDTIFKIFFIQIKYYNLLWITAFVVGLYLMKKIFKNENKSLEKLDSLFIYAVVSIMLGARLGHVIFYDWDYYQDHLLEILLPIRERADSSLFGFINGWEFTGFTGLASHGATIGAFIALYLLSRKFKDMGFMWLLDRVAVVSSIGTAFVRLGNFFNSEINGKVTSAAYKAIETKPEYAEILEAIPYRHPAQLYEAFLYFILFGIMYFAYWKTDKSKKPGFLFGLFMLGLWSARFFVEYFKKSQGGFEDTWGTFTTGQWLSIPMILVGLYFMFRPNQEQTS